MDKYRRIAELMKGFQQTGQVFIPATVESVEGNTCTINVEDFSIPNVRLKPTTSEDADEILLVSAKGSNVLVGSVSGGYNNLFIVQSDKISEMRCKIGETSFKMDLNGIEINGGKNGGVMKINDVVSWMQNVYADMQTLQAQLSIHPVTGNGAALGLVFDPATPSPQTATFEDEKLKH